MKKLILVLFFIFVPSLAFAQCNGVFGANTVCGSISGGFPTSIPDTAVIGSIAPSIPVIHPSSGNLVGAGCVPVQSHSLWWVDQNLCSYSDSWNWNSSDPSALFTSIVGGTVTVGDRINLTFTFGSGACVAGCTVGYTAITSDTVTKIANGLICAIANNANLFNLNGSTCTNGVVTNIPSGTGGYAGGQIVGYIGQAGGGAVDFDFNSTVPLKLVAAITGSATETFTIGNTGCGTVCSNAWDVNPTFIVGRNTGVAPSANSQGFAIVTVGTTSASPNSIVAQYGIIANTIKNSTTGALDAMWTISTPDVNGVINRGLNVRAGAYTVGQPDPGYDNMGTNQYWFGQNNDAIYRSGANYTFHSGPNDNYLFDSTGYAVFTGSVGVNMSPTGKLDVNGYMGSFGQSGSPTSGSGIILGGSTSPLIQARTFPSGAWLPTGLLGLSWDFQPSNGTGGWTLSANQLTPDTDNVTTLGSAALAPSTVYSHGLAFTASSTADTFINRFATANVRFGSATDSTTPIAQTVSVQNVLTGTSNTAGANLTISGSRGTGTGNGGSILLQTARAGTTGTTQNALSTAMTLDGNSGIVSINTPPLLGDSRFIVEDGSGLGQLKLRYTGKTGVQFFQQSSGNFQFNLQDNANFTIFTNNGGGAELQLYGSGGTSIGSTPVDAGANNLYVQGNIQTAGALIAKGSSPVGTTGTCAATSFVGGATAGKFAVAVCTAGTVILSSLPTAPNGYTCNAQDQTTPGDTLKQTANTVSSVTFTATTVAADVVVFQCIAW